MNRTLFASGTALAIQPLVFAVTSALLSISEAGVPPVLDYLGISVAVVAVAMVHLLVLGLPGFFLLKRLGALSWWIMGILGFVVGSAAVAVYSWPYRAHIGYSVSSLWHGQFTPLIVDGTPTTAGWLNYIEGVALFGVHGLVGALAFLAVWRRHEA